MYGGGEGGWAEKYKWFPGNKDMEKENDMEGVGYIYIYVLKY